MSAVESLVQPRRMFAVLGGFFPAGEERPDPRPDPMFCPKLATPVAQDGESIAIPATVTSVVMEAEMAVVVGARVRHGDLDESREAIAGYTCCNDVTAPQHFPHFYLAKGIDGFGALGPAVVAVEEAAIRDGLAITGRINGVAVQTGNTRHYRYLPAELISYLSQFFTLEPGDVITLGTPPPPPPVTVGDEVEVEVEGVGVLTNRMVAETADAPASAGAA